MLRLPLTALASLAAALFVYDPQAPRPVSARLPARLHAYELLGEQQQLASVDSLGSPRYLWPLICGRYAVAGIASTDANGNVFSGTIQDGAGGGALSIEFNNHDRAWSRILGTNTWTGATILTDGSAATVRNPSGSLAWTIGRRALLCLDADQVSNASTPWTAPAGLRISYTDGSGVVYVDGALTVTSGAQISVTNAPPFYPAPLVEAAGGISGAFTAGTLPAGYTLMQTASIVFLQHQ